jgi:hypothetical protein
MLWWPDEFRRGSKLSDGVAKSLSNFCAPKLTRGNFYIIFSFPDKNNFDIFQKKLQTKIKTMFSFYRSNSTLSFLKMQKKKKLNKGNGKNRYFLRIIS